jgi:3-oxoacyl-[acyl-carrier protein] reductase
MSVYLITGASSDVGTALIDRLYRRRRLHCQGGATFPPGPLCRKYPGAIKTYDVDLTDPAALELFVGMWRRVTHAHAPRAPARAARRKYQVQEF